MRCYAVTSEPNLCYGRLWKGIKTKKDKKMIRNVTHCTSLVAAESNCKMKYKVSESKLQ